MAKNKLTLKELENVLLDQIEKLSDDSIGEDKAATQLMIDRSVSISQLAANVISINQLKLLIVKELNKNDNYAEVLGIECKSI